MWIPLGKRFLGRARKRWRENIEIDLRKEVSRIRSLPTPSNRDLLQKLKITQLVEKLSVFYGTRMFITVCTRARHWSPF
jgi:hypothetical protein